MRSRKLLCAGFLFSLAVSCVAQQTAVDDPYTQHLHEAVSLAAQGSLSSAMGQIQAALALRPDDAAAWYQLGSLLGQAGDFPGAAMAFRRAISLQPDMAKAHYGLALTLIGNPQTAEDWPGAVAECHEALKFLPAYPEALNLLGVGLTKQGQYAAAIGALEQAIQLSPAYPEAHFNLGLALESNDRLDDAAAEYRAAISAKGQYPAASSALGKLLFRMGKPAAAEQEVTRALLTNPDLADAHYTRARILQSLHRNQEAATEFAIAKDLIQRPADGIQASQLSNQALTMASKGNLVQAAVLLRKAIALKPDYGVPHFNLGLILADQSKTKAAILELAKAVSLLPGQAPPWFELGRVLELANDERGAIQSVAWAAHLAPANEQIKSELARLQASAVAASMALPAVEQPEAGARSDTADAHLAFAQELNGQGDFQGAIGELLRALALQPAMQVPRRDLAAAYENLGDHERASLEYRKLLVSFPSDVTAHTALGKLLLAQGNAPDAVDHFKQALRYEPNSVEARALLRRADALAGQH